MADGDPPSSSGVQEEDEFEEFREQGALKCTARLLAARAAPAAPDLVLGDLGSLGEGFLKARRLADWSEQLEDPEDAQIWESSWDVEEVQTNEDFVQKLKAHLEQQT